MNHLATDTAIDRLFTSRSARALCRRRRRVRRRAEKGGCLCRPNQLGKIKGNGSRRGLKACLHKVLRGTRLLRDGAAISRRGAPAPASRRAVYATVRCSTPQEVSYPSVRDDCRVRNDRSGPWATLTSRKPQSSSVATPKSSGAGLELGVFQAPRFVRRSWTNHNILMWDALVTGSILQKKTSLERFWCPI